MTVSALIRDLDGIVAVSRRDPDEARESLDLLIDRLRDEGVKSSQRKRIK
jgi:uncharacterized coiled-coil protein SlyX